MFEQTLAFDEIIGGIARRANAGQSLTHSLDLGEEGLAMQATQSCSTPGCPDPDFMLWHSVGDYEEIYEIDSHGQVRRIGRRKGARVGHVLSLKVGKDGYKRVGLWNDNRERTFLVHVLVAKAFMGPPPSALHEVNHKDGVKINACWGNLEWVTRSENNAHAWRTGLRNGRNAACGEHVGGVKLTEAQVREIRRLYVPHKYGTPRLGRGFGVDHTTIRAIVKGENWKCVQ